MSKFKLLDRDKEINLDVKQVQDLLDYKNGLEDEIRDLKIELRCVRKEWRDFQ